MVTSDDNGIALLCTLYPASAEKQEKVLSLLRNSARNYYPLPTSLCTTWSYFTPINSSPNALPIIMGIEVYTNKSALQKQVDDKEFFQSYHKKVKDEGLYAKEEKLEAWYFHSGFMARDQGARVAGDKTIVSLSRFSGQRESIVQAIQNFLPFVKNKEPGVLTYAISTRTKAPNEVLVFARYRDGRALRAHGDAREHVVAAEEIKKYLDPDVDSEKTTTLWREVDDSFVGNVVASSRTSGVSGKL